MLGKTLCLSSVYVELHCAWFYKALLCNCPTVAKSLQRTLALCLTYNMSPHLSFENSMWPNDPVEEVLAHMHIHSRERVVQQVDVSVLIHGPGQAHSLLLTTAQVDALVGRDMHMCESKQHYCTPNTIKCAFKNWFSCNVSSTRHKHFFRKIVN